MQKKQAIKHVLHGKTLFLFHFKQRYTPSELYVCIDQQKIKTKQGKINIVVYVSINNMKTNEK